MGSLLDTPVLIKAFAEWCAATVEGLGILIIVVVAFYTVLFGVWRSINEKDRGAVFRTVRLRLGRGIMLGLEFLVAADIIHTVAVELTLSTVGVLAIIVTIRTFLSFTLEVELTGKWPWQQETSEGHTS